MITINGKKVESFQFSGGEVHVKLNALNIEHSIRAILKTPYDIMELLLVVDALKRISMNNFIIEIPYIPYARQDRINSSGEPLSIKVFSDLINSLGAINIIGWDVHSDVTSVLINNFVNIEQNYIVNNDYLKPLFFDNNWFICSPDAGSLKKIHKIQNQFKISNDRLIIGHKERDVSNGEIKNTSIIYKGNPKKVLIIDDICDGGKTFIELAKVMKKEDIEEIYLYVTHGIFSKGIDVFDGYIDKIFTTNSFCDIKHDKLTIIRR